MNLNDTAKLYQLFGGQAGDYQELRRGEQAKTAKQRWPLLAWLDLSALHVSQAPQVQLGETPQAAAQRPSQAAGPKLTPQFKPAPPAAPVAAPVANPVAPQLATPLANAFASPVAAPTAAPIAASTPAPQRVAKQVSGTFAQQIKTPASLAVKPITAPQAPVQRAPQARVPNPAPVPQPAPHQTPVPASSSASPRQPVQAQAQVTQRAQPSTGTAHYLQQLMHPVARLQALGGAPAPAPTFTPTTASVLATGQPVQAVSPVAQAAPVWPTTPVVPPVEVASQPTRASKVADNTGVAQLQDIFSRLAHPTRSSTPTPPAGSLWANLTSRL